MLYERLALCKDLLSESGSIYVHIGPAIGSWVRVLIDEIFGSQPSATEICWKRVTAHSDSKRWGVTHDYILWKPKSGSFVWNPQFAGYSEGYVRTKYTQRTEDGRVYQLDNLTSPNPRPNMTYEWRGHKPPRFGWRYEYETMERLFREGRIELARQEGGRPRLRRFLDEMGGSPIGSVWDDISPLNSQASEDTGYATQKPSVLSRLDRRI